jgi:nicotinamidase-related amidase
MEYERHGQDATALLVIDSYNDFISEGGKVWNRLKAVAEADSCVPHMLEVLHAARRAGLRVFYSLRRRYRPGDYETWTSMALFKGGPGPPRCSSSGVSSFRNHGSVAEVAPGRSRSC